MSHAVLQRLVVRMLYDPELAARGGDAAADLTPDERSWLLAVDRRAFGVDPLRRARTLAALLEEHPASAALVRMAGGDVRELDAFFSSATFHRTIMERGSLAAGFAAFLRDERPPRPGDPCRGAVALLEGEMARLRRTAPPRGARPGSPRLALSPWTSVLALPRGTLAVVEGIRDALARHPGTVVEALLDPALALPRPAAVDPHAAEMVLLERRADGAVAATPISGELAALLDVARSGATAAALADRLAQGGATAGEAREILEGLVDDGILHPN